MKSMAGFGGGATSLGMAGGAGATDLASFLELVHQVTPLLELDL